uniref:Uncharacterized protein n=1 Tax=Phyllostachys edulis TaxID=38705 RepID=D3IVT3_PHYED|nr:hypothetical protein [Phyllostachys edulis]
MREKESEEGKDGSSGFLPVKVESSLCLTRSVWDASPARHPPEPPPMPPPRRTSRPPLEEGGRCHRAQGRGWGCSRTGEGECASWGAVREEKRRWMKQVKGTVGGEEEGSERRRGRGRKRAGEERARGDGGGNGGAGEGEEVHGAVQRRRGRRHHGKRITSIKSIAGDEANTAQVDDHGDGLMGAGSGPWRAWGSTDLGASAKGRVRRGGVGQPVASPAGCNGKRRWAATTLWMEERERAALMRGKCDSNLGGWVHNLVCPPLHPKRVLPCYGVWIGFIRVGCFRLVDRSAVVGLDGWNCAQKVENVFEELIKAMKAPVEFDLPSALKEWKLGYYIPIKRSIHTDHCFTLIALP